MKPDTGEGPISSNLPKTYAISRFLAKILPVPISPNFFEIYITNYFVGGMNDVILMILFSKCTFFTFYLIAFGGVLNSSYFDDSLHWFTYCKTPYEVEKKCLTYYVISNVYAFFIFLNKQIISVSIYGRICQYCRIFFAKTFGDIGPSHVMFYY